MSEYAITTRRVQVYEGETREEVMNQYLSETFGDEVYDDDELEALVETAMCIVDDHRDLTLSMEKLGDVMPEGECHVCGCEMGGA